jgi:Animal haem peroxidase
MHGINLSAVPEIEDDMSFLAADPALAGMRNLLPLQDASMFGAGKDPRDLRNLMRRLSARISRDPHPQRPEDEDNRTIPSGYTYLLQFISHDLVNTSTSLAATAGRRFGFENARQQPLTLDNIYGGGPDVCPHAYEYSLRCAQSHGLIPRTRLRTGRAMGGSGSTKSMPFADVGRATPVDVRDDGIPGGTQSLLTEALVADARNEDHALIAQITGLFHRLHNFIIAQIDNSRPPETAPDAYRNFICARFLLTLIYRKIILHDVLRRLLDPSVIRYYLIEQRPLLGDNTKAIPVEFSHGAFRCGHAMVRNSYRVNSDTALDTGRALQICSLRSPNFVPLTEDWIVKWERFFEIGETVPNYSRRLRPNFSPIARSEQFFAPLNPKAGDNGDAAGLPNRDLVSAIYARVWSVPKLIDTLRGKSTEIANFLPAYQDNAVLLTNWLNATADPNGITEQFQPGDVATIVDDPPLPFYVLHEASHWHDGQRLGPLGSIIVAETIIAAMNASKMRFKDLEFDPRQSFKDQAEMISRLGVKDDALSKMPEIDTFEELLAFMQSEEILDSKN